MQLSTEARTCLRLMFQGQHEQAGELARKTLAEIDVRRQALELESLLIGEIAAGYLASLRSDNVSLPADGPIVPTMSTVERHMAIRRTGAEVAALHPLGYASTEAVQASMGAKGLVTPSKTAIGNVLRWTKGWTRVGTGLYKWGQKVVDENGSSRVPNDVVPVVEEVEEGKGAEEMAVPKE